MRGLKLSDVIAPPKHGGIARRTATKQSPDKLEIATLTLFARNDMLNKEFLWT